ncbi:MAG: dTMP kinase [Patescibacteria group bacterium]
MITRQKNDGLQIVIEGIDGSGKSTVSRACEAWAESRGKKFFNVIEFSERENRLPTLEEIGDVNGLLTAEPTFCWTGRAIRDEIIAKRENETEPRYSGLETAHAFSLDRLVQLRKVTIPFLRARPDRIVIQDRSFASTLAYQPLQDESLTSELLLGLPGNAQTIAFCPSLMILIRTEAAAAMARLESRGEKRDEAIFEEKDFQTKLVQRFLSDEVLGPFKQAGTLIGEVDGNRDIDTVSASVKDLLSQKLPDFGKM